MKFIYLLWCFNIRKKNHENKPSKVYELKYGDITFVTFTVAFGCFQNSIESYNNWEELRGKHSCEGWNKTV